VGSTAGKILRKSRTITLLVIVQQYTLEILMIKRTFRLKFQNLKTKFGVFTFLLLSLVKNLPHLSLLIYRLLIIYVGHTFFILDYFA
jgi:hypothetical protein